MQLSWLLLDDVASPVVYILILLLPTHLLSLNDPLTCLVQGWGIWFLKRLTVSVMLFCLALFLSVCSLAIRLTLWCYWINSFFVGPFFCCLQLCLGWWSSEGRHVQCCAHTRRAFSSWLWSADVHLIQRMPWFGSKHKCLLGFPLWPKEKACLRLDCIWI